MRVRGRAATPPRRARDAPETAPVLRHPARRPPRGDRGEVEVAGDRVDPMLKHRIDDSAEG